MAHSLPRLTGHQAGDSFPTTACSREDLIRAHYTHHELYDDIDNNRPEGDIRHRFLGLRASRASFVAFVVAEKQRAYETFGNELKQRTIDCSSEETWKRFEDIIIGIGKSLSWYSRCFEEDSCASQAPDSTQFFVDNVFRHRTAQKGLRAPDGQLLSLYGPYGGRVPKTFAATRGCEEDLLRVLFLKKLLSPPSLKIYRTCVKFYCWILGREPGPMPQGFSGRTLSLIVIAVECMIFIGCLAGSVSLAVNLNSMRDRIIATSIFSLVSPYAIAFLSKGAIRMFASIAAYWAVMAVFVAMNDSGLKHD